MIRLKILHAADLHLDSPFDGLSDGRAAKRRQEQRELLSRLAELAVSEKADIVLLPGDLFDSDSTFTETAEELVKALSAIPAPVLISPGNHDCYSASSPYAKLSFPRNVHIFTKNELECVMIPHLNVRVWGAAFTSSVSRGLTGGFSVEKKEGSYDLLCIHGEIAAEGRYNPVTEAELSASGIDYAAFGHIHTASGLKKAGNTYYAWPGCPEGRGFDETGEKYVYSVELCDGECTLKPVCIAGRRYELLRVELTDHEPLEAIKSALPEHTEKDIYRIILCGETAEAPDIIALRESLEGSFFALSLRDETRLRRDIWDCAGEDSLRGQFLARLKSAFENASDESEKEKLTQAARWGLAALDKREEVVTHGN